MRENRKHGLMREDRVKPVLYSTCISLDFAKRQYMKVDPENRLIAEELEAEWNVKADVITANVRFKGARRGS